MAGKPTKVRLRVPTMGKKRGDVIEVESITAAEALVANGTARRLPEEKSSKD